MPWQDCPYFPFAVVGVFLVIFAVNCLDIPTAKGFHLIFLQMSLVFVTLLGA